MVLVSIVGYAKSGKTTTAVELIAALVERGTRVAALKIGHQRPATIPGSATDSARLNQAGASLSIFWAGNLLEIEEDEQPTRRVQNVSSPGDPHFFASSWKQQLPADLIVALECYDVLLIEGRRVAGALVLHLEKDGECKYAVARGEVVVRTPEDLRRAIITVHHSASRNQSASTHSHAGQGVTDNQR
jgi:molybdopterin-guanine dinucleotide biosynthesis protein MobB